MAGNLIEFLKLKCSEGMQQFVLSSISDVFEGESDWQTLEFQWTKEQIPQKPR
jgi:hypothetical protein